MRKAYCRRLAVCIALLSAVGASGRFYAEEQSVQISEAPPEESVVVLDDWPPFIHTDCPPEILKFVEKYPEAEAFARDFSLYGNEEQEIDLSGEVSKGEIPLFIQWEPRWGYRSYGSSYLGITGCGPTCLSMVWCGLTGETEWDPWALAAWAEEQGLYQSGVGTAWELMTYGAKKLGLTQYDVSASEAGVRAMLEAGRPVIVSVGPGDFTYEGHFIVLTEIDEEANVMIRDPNSPAHSQEPWALSVILSQARKLWAFDVTKQ